MALEYLLAFVVLLSVLIFVHEVGHFTAAKLCGVRVLKFSMGFGPPIGFGRFRLLWKRGGTEYVVAWIPMGGFVKMLGENPDGVASEEAVAHPDQSLGGKPLWQKLSIVFAGPAMNLVLPVVVFAGMLAVGMPRPAAVVGMVEEGSPAAQTPLRPGDRITEFAGVPVAWWDDLVDAVRSRPGEQVEVTYRRRGESARTTLTIGSRQSFDEFGTVQTVGWVGIGHARLRAMVGVPRSASPAHGAGLRSGDVIRAVAGEPVEDWSEFAAGYGAAPPGGAVGIEVERGEGEDRETLQLEVPALGDVSALGVIPASALVSFVTPDSPAQRAGLEPGDLILAVDGEAVGSFEAFRDAVRTSGGRTLQLDFARNGQPHRVSLAPELVPVDTGLGIEEPRYLVGIRAEAAALEGAMAVDLERNPLVAIPRAVEITVDMTSTFLRGLGKIITGEVSRRQIAGPIGIAQIAGNALARGWDTYLAVMVLISINLGILNLLPIPILDGGQAALFLVEAVKRQPLSLRSREIFQQIGLTVLVLLMGMAFWNDISRHWSKLLGWLRSGPG